MQVRVDDSSGMAGVLEVRLDIRCGVLLLAIVCLETCSGEYLWDLARFIYTVT